MAGIRLNQVALSVLVFDLTGDPLDLGLLAAATAGPTIVVSIFGGVFADLRDTGKLLAVSTAIISSVLSLIAVLVVTDSIEIWHVFALAAVNGVALGLDAAVTDVSIAGYTISCENDSDIHADIDVLVLKSNGGIRDTLATHVAAISRIQPTTLRSGCTHT